MECRGTRPGRRERKGVKGDWPEALASVDHRWWPPWLRHPVRATRSLILCGAGASGSGEQPLRAQSVAIPVRRQERHRSFSERAGNPAWEVEVSSDLASGLSPRISEVRPPGILARERCLRLRMPCLPPHCPVPWPHRLRSLELSARDGSLGPSRSLLGTSPPVGPFPRGPQSLSLGQWTSWPVAGKQSKPKDEVRQKDSLSGAPKWAVMSCWCRGTKCPEFARCSCRMLQHT